MKVPVTCDTVHLTLVSRGVWRVTSGMVVKVQYLERSVGWFVYQLLYQSIYHLESELFKTQTPEKLKSALLDSTCG